MTRCDPWGLRAETEQVGLPAPRSPRSPLVTFCFTLNIGPVMNDTINFQTKLLRENLATEDQRKSGRSTKRNEETKVTRRSDRGTSTVETSARQRLGGSCERRVESCAKEPLRRRRSTVVRRVDLRIRARSALHELMVRGWWGRRIDRPRRLDDRQRGLDLVGEVELLPRRRQANGCCRSGECHTRAAFVDEGPLAHLVSIEIGAPPLYRSMSRSISVTTASSSRASTRWGSSDPRRAVKQSASDR